MLRTFLLLCCIFVVVLSLAHENSVYGHDVLAQDGVEHFDDITLNQYLIHVVPSSSESVRSKIMEFLDTDDIQYVPHHSFVTVTTPKRASKLPAHVEEVVWIGELDPLNKIDRELDGLLRGERRAAKPKNKALSLEDEEVERMIALADEFFDTKTDSAAGATVLSDLTRLVSKKRSIKDYATESVPGDESAGVTLAVLLFPLDDDELNSTVADFKRTLTELGTKAHIDVISKEKFFVHVPHRHNNVQKAVDFLTKQNFVQHVSLREQFMLMNKYARWVTQSDVRNKESIWARGLTGKGEIIAAGDTGVDYNNCMFYDSEVPVPFNKFDFNHRKIVSYFTVGDNKDANHGHGTHVVGSIAGAARELPEHLGMAYEAKVAFIDLGLPNGLLKLPADLNHEYFKLTYKKGKIVIHNSSWGSQRFGEYTLAAREVDQFAWEHKDFLPIFAAGNSGRSGSATITSPGTAKNALTVGASQSVYESYLEGWPTGFAEHMYSGVRKHMCESSSPMFLSESFCASAGLGMSPCSDQQPTVCDMLNGTRSCCDLPLFRKFCCPDYLYEKVQRNPEHFDESNIAVFSSRGPTTDGRTKPDIVAPGEVIFSAHSDGTSSGPHCGQPLVKKGTSMAAPIVAGLAALMLQYFREGYYPSGKKTSADGFVPTGALLKSLIINSGVELRGLYDVNGKDNFAPLPSGIPSHVQGYGRIKLDNVLRFTDSPFDLWFDEKSELRTAEQKNYCFTAVAPSNGTAKRERALKVTLVWMDYPGNPSSKIALVNNLDLVVVDNTNAREYLGNGKRDFLNNVEQVVIEDPQPGATYSVIVRGVNVPMGPQPYALVVTGNFRAGDSDSDANDAAQCVTRSCPHACSNNGVCDSKTLTCTCNAGFHGADCSVETRPLTLDNALYGMHHDGETTYYSLALTRSQAKSASRLLIQASPAVPDGVAIYVSTSASPLPSAESHTWKYEPSNEDDDDDDDDDDDEVEESSSSSSGGVAQVSVPLATIVVEPRTAPVFFIAVRGVRGNGPIKLHAKLTSAAPATAAKQQKQSGVFDKLIKSLFN